MRNLLDFLARHNHWFLFLLLEAVSIILLFRYNSYQGSVWFSSANAVAGKVYAWSSAVEQYFSLTEVNEKLTQRNLYLERQLAAVAEQQVKVNKDTTYLERLQMETMRGLDKRLTDKINIKFHIAEDPLHSVAKGTGIALKNIDRFSFLMR